MQSGPGTGWLRKSTFLLHLIVGAPCLRGLCANVGFRQTCFCWDSTGEGLTEVGAHSPHPHGTRLSEPPRATLPPPTLTQLPAEEIKRVLHPLPHRTDRHFLLLARPLFRMGRRRLFLHARRLAQ